MQISIKWAALMAIHFAPEQRNYINLFGCDQSIPDVGLWEKSAKQARKQHFVDACRGIGKLYVNLAKLACCPFSSPLSPLQSGFAIAFERQL